MKIHQVRWCTLNKLDTRFQCVTNTLQYDGIRCHMTKLSQNFVLFYTFYIFLRCSKCTLHFNYAYVNVHYMYNSTYVRRLSCISFSLAKNANVALDIRFYTLIQV